MNIVDGLEGNIQEGTMTEREKMISGLAHNSAEKSLVTERQHTRELLAEFNASAVENRSDLLKAELGAAGEKLHIKVGFQCDYLRNVFIGDRFFANFYCIFLASSEIHIGDDCRFGPMVNIYTTNHPQDPEERKTGTEYAKPVLIGNNVWIGGNVTINPGVHIGDNAVIASGSVVIHDVEANTVVAGNPAKFVKKI